MTVMMMKIKLNEKEPLSPTPNNNKRTDIKHVLMEKIVTE